MALLPLSTEPFQLPTNRDMLPSERRKFVDTHRTCVLAYARRNDGPAQSVVYYIPTDDGEILIANRRHPREGWAEAYEAAYARGDLELTQEDKEWLDMRMLPEEEADWVWE